MYTHIQILDSRDVTELRQACGNWLRSLREARGATRAEIAVEVGNIARAYVYQVEVGTARISPERYQEWADALGVDLKDFAIELMRFYDPITHRLLFSDEVDGT